MLLILHDRYAPILTRELIYTAVTHARERIEIRSDEEIFIQTASRHIQ
ncbi:MAG: hypothetical protein ACYC5X_14405 [Syntrophales bacterium]